MSVAPKIAAEKKKNFETKEKILNLHRRPKMQRNNKLNSVMKNVANVTERWEEIFSEEFNVNTGKSKERKIFKKEKF